MVLEAIELEKKNYVLLADLELKKKFFLKT
jgi:hypothetical protein